MNKCVVLCICLLLSFASCSNINSIHNTDGDAQSDSSNSYFTEDHICEREQFEGWFLRTDESPFFIADGDSVRFENNEAVKIHIPTWEKDPSVRFDDLHNGDKIVVEVLQIGDTEPRDMPVYAIERLGNGSIANIADSVLTYLQELGFTVVESMKETTE